MTQRSFWKQKSTQRLLLALLLLLYFTAVYTLFPLLGLDCVFLTLFGIPCPGCGMSRAVAALFRLDFVSAWNYHPLVFAMPYVVLYLFCDFKPPRLHNRILLAIGIAALIHWAFVLLQH